LADVDAIFRCISATELIDVILFGAGTSRDELFLREMERPARQLFQVADVMTDVFARDLVNRNEDRNIERRFASSSAFQAL
jgi:hypothetical protein